jgi:hypothetical protein
LVWATESAEMQLLEEIKGFPSRRMDVLDALKIAVFKSYKPRGVDGEEDSDYPDDDVPHKRINVRRLRVNPTTGY